MSQPFDVFGLTKSPFVQRHVESHLFFGPMSRNVFPFWGFMGVVVVVLAGMPLLSGRGPFALIEAGFGLSFFGWVLLRSAKKSPKDQVYLTFVTTKIMMGFGAILMTFLAGPIHWLTKQPDALPVWGLGLVWFPGLEYIPRLTEHQKFITLARMILSLPLIWLGVTTGGWTL
jgi:hypothetical protein